VKETHFLSRYVLFFEKIKHVHQIDSNPFHPVLHLFTNKLLLFFFLDPLDPKQSYSILDLVFDVIVNILLVEIAFDQLDDIELVFKLKFILQTI